MIMKLTLILIVSISQQLSGFHTIEQLKRYEESLPELHFQDEADLIASQKYLSTQQSWWQRLLIRIGLKKGPAWDPLAAYSCITKMYEFLSEKKYTEQIRQEISLGTEVIVFGGIRGSFHSLSRAICDLHNRGYLSHDFKLKPHTYLVFLGDTLDTTFSGLETLSLLFSLLQTNTQNVILLAGQIEANQEWKKTFLPNELKLRIPEYAAHISTKIDMIYAKLPQKFLATLKETHENILFTTTLPPTQVMKALIMSDYASPAYQEGQGLYKKLSPNEPITWQIVSTPTTRYRMEHKFFLNAYACISFTDSLMKSTISLYTSTTLLPFQHNATYNLLTGALLTRGQAPFSHMRNTQPLSPEEVALHISAIQALTDSLKQEIGSIATQLPDEAFAPPAFEMPPLIKKLKASSLVTPQDVQQAVHELELTYNALSREVSKLQSLAQLKGLKGESLSREDTKKSFTLGSSLDLSKSSKGIGIPFKTGMSLKVHEQNRSGGIHGKRAHIIFLDDENRPALSERNIELLRDRDHTPYILAPVGSATLAASLDLIEEKQILVLFPQSGSLLYRKPELTHVVNFRPSYLDEGRFLTEFVQEHYRPKNFVLFYQDDESGSSILEGAKKGLAHTKNAHITAVPYQSSASNFESAARKIKEANPDAIGFFGLGPAVLELIRDVGVEFFANKILFASSSVCDTATMKVLQEWGISCIRSQVVPDSCSSSLPIALEYRNEIKSQGLKEDQYSFEAYIVTSFTFHALNAVTEPVTISKLISYFESIKNLNYKGLTLNFNPTSRSVSDTLWIIDKNGTSHLMKTGGVHESSN